METLEKIKSITIEENKLYASMTQPVNPAILEVPDLADLEEEIYGIKDGNNDPKAFDDLPKSGIQIKNKNIVSG